MAQVTFTISAENLPLFIEAFKEDYDQKVSDEDEDIEGVTESQYAKQNAFKFLATRTMKYHKQKQMNEMIEIDITQ